MYPGGLQKVKLFGKICYLSHTVFQLMPWIQPELLKAIKIICSFHAGNGAVNEHAEFQP